MNRSKSIGFLVLVGLLAVLMIGTTGSVAATTGTFIVAPLTLVSGPSPYANCTVAGSGTVYVNAEVEPYVAINPKNPNNIIGAWQQDRWSNGGARGLVASFSLNGGKSWSQMTLPFSACAPGGLPYERASDPWVSIGPDGIAYANAISFDDTTGRNAVATLRSTDGGKTWTDLVVLQAFTTRQFITDKNSVTADPVKPGVAYAVWDTLVLATDHPDDNPHTAAYTGPAYFSKTTDGGKTWSAPQVILSTGVRQQTIGNQIVVDPRNGTLYNFTDWILPPNSALFQPTNYNVAFVKSTDGGKTWSAPQIVDKIKTVGVTDPNTGQRVRTGDVVPEPAIDPASGRLYVVWQDSRFNGGHFDEVAISTSADGGATWSAPARVNTPTGKAAFTPMVKVSSDGTVGVTYYDFRNLQPDNTTTLPTDYWFTTSTNGGASFGNEVHVAGPFDMLTAPFARGFFVGDYEGMATSGTTFRPFFVQANSGNTANRTDVFTTTASP